MRLCVLVSPQRWLELPPAVLPHADVLGGLLVRGARGARELRPSGRIPTVRRGVWVGARAFPPVHAVRVKVAHEQPPVGERAIELLVHGVFAGFEGDRGYYSTTWVPLADVLMEVSRETVAAKLVAFRVELGQALEAALLAPAPVPMPAPAPAPAPASATASGDSTQDA